MDTKLRSKIATCKKCGDPLPLTPCNLKYCDKCRATAYRERYKKRKEKLKQAIKDGTKVKTKQYGIISRERYVELAVEWISGKYNIEGDYFDWVKKSEENMELNARAMDEFATEVGVVFQYTEVH